MSLSTADEVAAGEFARIRRLGLTDEAALRSLCARDPIAHCFVSSRIEASLPATAATFFLGSFDGAEKMRSAVYVGANLVPVETDEPDRHAFAAVLEPAAARISSIVGPQDEVLDLWRKLEVPWGPAREVRVDQQLLVIDRSSDVEALPAVRPVHESELELFVPACVAMFTAEVGISPLAGGMAAAYHARVSETVRAGRALALLEGKSVVFKAEVGSIADGVCQIQGVWVDPAHRGRGIGTAGMAAVVDYTRANFAPVVSLYVNHYNEAARRAYARVGFAQHATFATVLR